MSRKTKSGLEAARLRGEVGGRVIDDDKGESIRVIASGLGVSVGAFHAALTEIDREIGEAGIELSR